MKVDLPRLAPEGESFEGRLPAKILEIEGDPLFGAMEDISYRLHAKVVSGRLLVRGRLDVRLRGLCVRCAEAFDLEVAEPDFFADYPLDESVVEVDLTPEMREAIILDLPAHPACRRDCRGLCPSCGVNLNRDGCNCGAPEQIRWSVWDALGR